MTKPTTTFKALIMLAALFAAPAVSALGPVAAADDQTAAGDAAIEQLYREGRAALNRSDWATARERFAAIAEQGGEKADAALYWEAYAAHEQGERSDALELIRTLQRDFPESSWAGDAEALEVEIRGARAVGRSDDDELKLMALNALALGDPEEALPQLRRIFASSKSPELRRRALYVMAQVGTAEAASILAEVARSDADAELRREAVNYLAIFGGRGSLAALESLYASGDREVRAAILHGYMVADASDQLLRAAQEEQDPELRMAAVHNLGLVEAVDDLWELFGQESSEEVKERILHALFLADDAEHLMLVATDDAEPVELRRAAIHNLGLIESGDQLWQIYQSGVPVELKSQILHALFLADDAERLMLVATDDAEPMELRATAVHNLGLTESGEELWQIYESGAPVELKEKILHSLFLADDDERLAIVARDAAADPELRRTAIHNLGLVDGSSARRTLMEIYRSTDDDEIGEQALHGLFLQDAVEELVELFKSEDETSKKRRIIHYLGLIDSPAARRVLMEILDG